MNKKSNYFGFTLIEILVSAAIVITATTVVVAILVSSFRGVSKAIVSEEVRQNGNNAISSMSRIIPFADCLKGVSTDRSTYPPGCTKDVGYQGIQVVSGGQTRTLSCTNNLSIDSTTIIDATKINISNCKFTCSQDSDRVSPVININFSLSENGSSPEKNAYIPFATSIKMRNL